MTANPATRCYRYRFCSLNCYIRLRPLLRKKDLKRREAEENGQSSYLIVALSTNLSLNVKQRLSMGRAVSF